MSEEQATYGIARDDEKERLKKQARDLLERRHGWEAVKAVICEKAASALAITGDVLTAVAILEARDR